MSELVREFEKFRAEPLPNPGPRGEDEVTTFLRQLDAQRKLRAFSEGEWEALGSHLGLNQEEISELIEQAAGMVAEEQVDISDQDAGAWPGTDSAREAMSSKPINIGGYSDNPVECECECACECDDPCPDCDGCACCCCECE
jgi:hypothetical protein